MPSARSPPPAETGSQDGQRVGCALEQVLGRQSAVVNFFAAKPSMNPRKAGGILPFELLASSDPLGAANPLGVASGRKAARDHGESAERRCAGVV